MWHAAYERYPYPGPDPLNGSVRQRHVIYIQGLFPKGSAYYYALLARELKRHAALYDLEITCSPLYSPAPFVRRCDIKTTRNDDAVHTTYDFLEWHDIISRAQKKSLPSNILNALWCFSVHLKDGLPYRFARSNWKYLAAWLFPYVLFLGIGIVGASAIIHLVQGLLRGVMFNDALILLAEIALLVGLWFVNRRNWSSLLIRNFSYVTLHAKGGAPNLDARLDDFADYLVKECGSSKADEIIIVGHSFGTVLAVMAMEKALQRGLASPDKRIKLLTLGDLNCHTGFFNGRSAGELRRSVLALGRQKTIPWVVLYSGKDVFSFINTDPPTALSSIEEPPGAPLASFRWPLLYDATFRSALAPKDYRRFRWDFFMTHSQFIFAAHKREALYDYMRVVCGAVPLASDGERIIPAKAA